MHSHEDCLPWPNWFHIDENMSRSTLQKLFFLSFKPLSEKSFILFRSRMFKECFKSTYASREPRVFIYLKMVVHGESVFITLKTFLGQLQASAVESSPLNSTFPLRAVPRFQIPREMLNNLLLTTYCKKSMLYKLFHSLHSHPIAQMRIQ